MTERRQRPTNPRRIEPTREPAADVEERRGYDESRRMSDERLRSAVEAAEVGTWHVDLKTGLDARDASMNRLLGLEPIESTQPNEDFFARVHEDDRARASALFEAAVAGAGRYEVEMRIRRPSGEVRWVRDVGRIRCGPDGQPVYATGAMTDITEQRDAEEALRNADRRKDEFLATLAHELRNPLAPIRSGLDVLKRARDEATRRRAEQTIERQLGHMVRLVDDLLDVSRISRGQVELQRTRLALSAVIETAVETSRPSIEEGKHSLTVAMSEEPFWVDGDLTRLAQVVANLLNNAAKYTPEGGRIELDVHAERGDAVIRVTDTGTGIDAQALPRVFELFTRGALHQGRAQGGLGIGLSLVRDLVKMHGGTVAAESPGVGHGSTFKVRLPLAAPVRPVESSAGAAARDDARDDATTRRILVVDDNVDAAEMLAAMLDLRGHGTRVAHDGPDALVAAREVHPDVIFLDIGLPGMDGYEVARQLRADPAFAVTVLVALTGWGTEDDKRRAHEAGFDVHLTKPVAVDAVDAVVARGMHELRGARARTKPA
ncbi:MAG: rcsC [Labilithrix sp.]|nr:rcsC [Labilithrix sp.]